MVPTAPTQPWSPRPPRNHGPQGPSERAEDKKLNDSSQHSPVSQNREPSDMRAVLSLNQGDVRGHKTNLIRRDA